MKSVAIFRDETGQLEICVEPNSAIWWVNNFYMVFVIVGHGHDVNVYSFGCNEEK